MTVSVKKKSINRNDKSFFPMDIVKVYFMTFMILFGDNFCHQNVMQ